MKRIFIISMWLLTGSSLYAQNKLQLKQTTSDVAYSINNRFLFSEINTKSAASEITFSAFNTIEENENTGMKEDAIGVISLMSNKRQNPVNIIVAITDLQLLNETQRIMKLSLFFKLQK